MIISLFHDDVMTYTCLDFDIGIANICEQTKIRVITKYSIDRAYLTFYFSVYICSSIFLFIYLYAKNVFALFPSQYINFH